jgi:hypothetical protein
MENNPYIIENEALFRHRPELLQLILAIRYEMENAQRPANECLIDDVDLQMMLKVSKRTTANYRADQLIAYSRLSGKVFYLWSDVLEALQRNRVPAIQDQLKIKL